MKTKEDIVNVLRVIFPEKPKYMYDYIAALLQIENPITDYTKPRSTINYAIGTENFVVPIKNKPTALGTHPGIDPAHIVWDKSPITPILPSIGKRPNAIAYPPNLDAAAYQTLSGINTICYMLYDECVPRTVTIGDSENSPIKLGNEDLLRDAAKALEPLVEKYCPNNVWMRMIQSAIQVLDEQRSEEESCLK